MPSPSAELDVPPGSLNTSAVNPWLPGVLPVASFTKMTIMSTEIRRTETVSIESSVRVVILMSL